MVGGPAAGDAFLAPGTVEAVTESRLQGGEVVALEVFFIAWNSAVGQAASSMVSPSLVASAPAARRGRTAQQAPSAGKPLQ